MTSTPHPEHHELTRTLGIGALVLYGLGTIIGAGIYVLVGEVAGVAGAATPLAFLAAAVLSGFTGLSYAELVARHPAAEGSVAFVHEAFGSRTLSAVTGIAFAITGVVGAASITLGGASYLARLLPLPPGLLAGGVVIGFTVIASLRVAESVRIAALMSAVEIAGLCLVIAVGAQAIPDATETWMGAFPTSQAALLGLGAGTFVAFFAYIGFEGMANMAEETQDVAHTLPRAILLAVAASAVLYALVSIVVVSAVPLEVLKDNPAPLIPVLERFAPELVDLFIAVAVIATLNGVLIHIVVVSRLAFGMARRGHWWSWLGRLHPVTRTPVHATVVIGGVVLVLVTAVPFQALVHLTSGITLLVFTAVNAALWRLKQRDPRPAQVPLLVPHAVPIVGTFACAGLAAMGLWSWVAA